MTQEELTTKANKFAENCAEPYTPSHRLVVKAWALEGYQSGYQDAQSEVKDTAIVFAEWVESETCDFGGARVLSHEYDFKTPNTYSIRDLYDLFLASQNKQP